VRWLLALVVVVATLGYLPASAVAQSGEDAPGDAEPAWGRRQAGPVVLSTAHFDVAVPNASPLSERAEGIAAVAEAVLPDVQTRLGATLSDRVRLEIWPGTAARGDCAPRAAAMPAARRILLFASPVTLEPGALRAFLAHELGHQLTYDRWATLGPDRRLSEGLATWAAEPYWLQWRGWSSLDTAVADLVHSGAVESLGEEPAGCLVPAQRDVYYSAWASLVDYLVRHYGWDAFGEALMLPASGDDRADYDAAFGHTLDDIVADWRRELGAIGR
jgi:hypothetical protein